MSSRRPFAARVLGPAIAAYGLIGVAIGVATLASMGMYGNHGLHLEMFVGFVRGAVWAGAHLLVALGGIGLIGSRAWSVHLLLVLLTGLALYNGVLFVFMVIVAVAFSNESRVPTHAPSQVPSIALWAIIEGIPTVCLVLFNGRRREEVERYDTARILKTDADG